MCSAHDGSQHVIQRCVGYLLPYLTHCIVVYNQVISPKRRIQGWQIMKLKEMNSTEEQNPWHKMQVVLLAETKTPLESSGFA